MGASLAHSRGSSYELVWGEPILKVAAKFGVSDVAIAKLCKRLNVPRPPRGYWAKLENGKPVRQPKLPKLEKGQSQRDSLPKRPPVEPAQDASPLAYAQSAFERENRIQISETLTDPDPILQRIIDWYATARVDKKGFLIARKKDAPEFLFTRETWDDGYRILDALLKAFRLRGFAVKLGSVISVTTPAGVVDFKIEETHWFAQRTIVHRDPDRWTRNIYEPPRMTTTYTRNPSGRVVLRITTETPLSDRTIWTDTESRPIRSQLSAFIVGMVRLAENRQIEFERRETREAQAGRGRAHPSRSWRQRRARSRGKAPGGPMGRHRTMEQERAKFAGLRRRLKLGFSG